MKFNVLSVLKKIVLVNLILLTALFTVSAEESENDSNPNSWQITSYSGKNKVQINKNTKNFESFDDALAYWIYAGIKEDNKICISRNKVFVTAKPSNYSKKSYLAINEQFTTNRDKAISDFNIIRDDKIEAAFAKKSGKKSKSPKSVVSKNHVAFELDPIESEETTEPEQSEEVAQTPVEEAPVEVAETEPEISEDEVETVDEVIVEAEPDEVAPVEETVSAVAVAVSITEPEPETPEESVEVTEEPEVEAVPEVVEEPKVAKEPETPKKTIKRYRKEYLQDFIPVETELPDNQQKSKKTVISNPDEIDSNQVTLLMKAAKAGNDWQIKELLSAGANVNLKDKDGWTALMYAVRYQENINTVNMLINAKSDIKTKNKFESSALVIASCYNNNPAIIEKLLSYYSPSEREVIKAFDLLLSTPQTSEYTQIAKINVFLHKDISINSYYDGKTPLMYAAQFGTSTEVLKILIDNDALTNLRSTEGQTAFDYAAANSSLKHDDNFWLLNKK